MKKLIWLVVFIPFFLVAQEKSWNEIGIEHYLEQNYDSAIFYFEKLTEAEPNDNDNWYNLACTYALNADKEKAIFALGKAVDKGFLNCNHIMNDSDLESIQEADEFNNILNKCNQFSDDNKIQDYSLNHVEMISIGTYGLLMPENYNSEKEYRLVVWIHGNGSNETYHARIASEMELEDVIIVFPRAPYVNKLVTEASCQVGYTSNQTDGIEKSDSLYTSQGALYVDWINKCVLDVKKQFKLKDKILLFGHSQGAAYSLAYALQYPGQVKASMSFAGGKSSKFPIHQIMLEQLAESDASIVLLQGVNDELHKNEYAENLYELLKNVNVKVDLKLIEAGHQFGNSKLAKNEVALFINGNL